MPSKKSYILDDLPTDHDALDFTPYVKTLVGVCKTASTPLTIGVFGTWGAGKTSLMRMVQKRLPKSYTVVWFDAWKYDSEEVLWRSFLLTVLLAVEQKSGETEELKILKTMLYRGLELEKAGGVTIDLAKLGAKIAQGAVQIGLSFIPPLAQLNKLVEELASKGVENLTENSVDAIRRERIKIYIEQVRSLEQFQEKFRTLVKSYVAPGRLVVFVDDLDRCLPEKAIEVLEAIKLFVDAPGCVFVLGLAQEVIARGVEIRYKDFLQDNGKQRTMPIDGTHYLEKIIQLPFTIPPIERVHMEPFVRGLVGNWPRVECPDVFAEGLGDNPRQIKRTVNLFLMLWQLAQERQLQDLVKPVRLAKIVVIQAVAPDLYRLLADRPELLRDIESYYRQNLSPRVGERSGEHNLSQKGSRAPESDNLQLPEDLLRLISITPVLQKILTMHLPDLDEVNFNGLNYPELRLYFTLTRPVTLPQPVPEKAVLKVFEPQVVRIPAGKFLMGSTKSQVDRAVKDGATRDWVRNEMPQHSVEVGEYFIGKYPVTNSEYQFFISETGHSSPRGWNGAEFPDGAEAHPVIYVSSEDASSYCAWLSQKTGKTYRLPTEAEWEKAARGMDGRVYPWGDEFDPQKANTSESGIGGTSPVGQYSPQGDSHYGCADMTGNVWEWCQDWYAEKEYERRQGSPVVDPRGPETGQVRVVRGGSWLSLRDGARCACRSRSVPGDFLNGLGFRVALSPS